MLSFDKKYKIMTLFGDLFALTISLIITLSIRYFELPNLNLIFIHLKPFLILFVLFIFIYYIFGLYEPSMGLKSRISSGLIIKTHLVNILISISFFYFIPFFFITPKTILIIFSVISLMALIIWRFIILGKLTKNKKTKVIVIGESDNYREISNYLVNQKQDYDLIFSYNTMNLGSGNSLDNLQKLIREKDIDLAIIDSDRISKIDFLSLFSLLQEKNIKTEEVNEFYEYLFRKVSVNDINISWLIKNIKNTKSIHSIYKNFPKRALDLSLAILVSPIFFVFIIILFVHSKIFEKDSLFYLDMRVGKNRKNIKIIKFRTMNSKTGEISKISGIIRIFRIDELPQIINVIKGELSFFGPRPEKTEMVEEYQKEIPFYEFRYSVKPGLSGWAQIYHDNHPHGEIDIIETKEKLAYDLYYIKHRSFFLDLRIALKTIRVIIFSKGK